MPVGTGITYFLTGEIAGTYRPYTFFTGILTGVRTVIFHYGRCAWMKVWNGQRFAKVWNFFSLLLHGFTELRITLIRAWKSATRCFFGCGTSVTGLRHKWLHTFLRNFAFVMSNFICNLKQTDLAESWMVSDSELYLVHCAIRCSGIGLQA